MPCQITDEEARQIEKNDNRQKYGVASTDADIAVTVACMACERLEVLAKMSRAPKLVQLWWAEHKRRDEERQRDETAAARQKEADERATLSRLQKKYGRDR